jgi:hypothetical protein
MRHKNDGNMHKRNIPVKLPQLSEARYFCMQPTILVVLTRLKFKSERQKSDTITQWHKRYQS